MKAPSLKQLQIDKSSQKMIIFASVASFLLIFTLFSSKALITKMNFQNKVINLKNTALNHLNNDVTNNTALITSYQNFINSPKNLMGVDSGSTGANSGNNAKLILDALPSEYDFPALATSLQGLLSSTGVTVSGLTGSDSSTGSNASTMSMPIAGTTPIPFSFTVSGPVDNVLNTMKIFESSIRPFQFSKFTISGSNSSLSLTASAETFYQPAQSFNVNMTGVQ
jgi:hypothetical protein